MAWLYGRRRSVHKFTLAPELHLLLFAIVLPGLSLPQHRKAWHREQLHSECGYIMLILQVKGQGSCWACAPVANGPGGRCVNIICSSGRPVNYSLNMFGNCVCISFSSFYVSFFQSCATINIGNHVDKTLPSTNKILFSSLCRPHESQITSTAPSETRTLLFLLFQGNIPRVMYLIIFFLPPFPTAYHSASLLYTLSVFHLSIYLHEHCSGYPVQSTPSCLGKTILEDGD